jgi:hypothetical protein
MIRKITSKQDEEKKRKRNQIIVSVILVSIMLFSTLGYSFGTNSGERKTPGTTINYNGYDFTYLNGLWEVNVSENSFGFINNPNDAYAITTIVQPLADYSGKVLYLYSENPDSESEIYRNLYLVSQGIIPACPEGENCIESVISKTCDNNFIIIREKSEVKVYQNEGCVYIEGPASDLAKITDGFLLKTIGIQ